MSNSSQLELLISIPWGNRPGEIPPAFEDYPSFSEVSAEQMRKVRTPFRISLDPEHGVHVLTEVPPLQPTETAIHIYHFGERGDWQGITPVEIEDAHYCHIRDYAVQSNCDCYLLERIRRGSSDESENRLRKITRDGTPSWSRVGTFSDREIDFRRLRGNYSNLLIDQGQRLYLPATESGCAIAEIDTQDGEVRAIYDCETLGPKTFLRAEKVYSVVYLPSEKKRALACFDMNRGQTELTLCDDDLFGWLIYPFGVDGSARFYAFRRPMIGQIDSSGLLLRKFPLDNIVVQPSTQDIYVSYLSTEREGQAVIKVDVHRPQGSIESRQISLPSRLAEIKDWKLIHVDEMDRLLIFGGEQPGCAGTLLILSKTGTLEKELSPPGDLLSRESRLESFSYWQVDSEGRIYLPVTDGQAFRVIRLTLD